MWTSVFKLKGERCSRTNYFYINVNVRARCQQENQEPRLYSRYLFFLLILEGTRSSLRTFAAVLELLHEDNENLRGSLSVESDDKYPVTALQRCVICIIIFQCVLLRASRAMSFFILFSVHYIQESLNIWPEEADPCCASELWINRKIINII